jgi:hypothetical protein
MTPDDAALVRELIAAMRHAISRVEDFLTVAEGVVADLAADPQPTLFDEETT